MILYNDNLLGNNKPHNRIGRFLRKIHAFNLFLSVLYHR